MSPALISEGHKTLTAQLRLNRELDEVIRLLPPCENNWSTVRRLRFANIVLEHLRIERDTIQILATILNSEKGA